MCGPLWQFARPCGTDMLALPYGMREKKLKLDKYQADSEGLELAKSTSKNYKTCDLTVFYSILVGSFPASIFFFGGLAIKVRMQLLVAKTGVGGQIGGQSQ